MNDKALLEAAAKAAGITDKYWDDQYKCFGYFQMGDDDFHGQWNPLTDDGDALRLAVKLNMRVVITGDAPIAVTDCATSDGHWVEGEPHMDDPYAATRRAITRAAAGENK